MTEQYENKEFGGGEANVYVGGARRSGNLE